MRPIFTDEAKGYKAQSRVVRKEWGAGIDSHAKYDDL
jgi:hypothetical protein